MPWGSSVYAKVFATNVVGSSAFSTVENGGVIRTTPDPPINLADVASVTSATQIGLSWDEAVFNGGSYVLDYRLWYSTDGTSFSVV